MTTWRGGLCLVVALAAAPATLPAQADAAATYAAQFRALAQREPDPAARRYLLESAEFMDCITRAASDARALACSVPTPPQGYAGPRAAFSRDAQARGADQSGDFRNCALTPCIDTAALRTQAGSLLEQTRAYENNRVTIRRQFTDVPAAPAPAPTADTGRHASAPSQTGNPPRVVPVTTGLTLRWVGRLPEAYPQAGDWTAAVQIINDNEFAVDVNIEAFVLCPDGNLLQFTIGANVRWFGEVQAKRYGVGPCSNGYPPAPDARVTLRYTATQTIR